MSEELNEETLGRRIRLARTDSGMTQQELADAIGSDQSGVSRLEAGKDVSTLLLTRIARATGKEVDFFLRVDAVAEARTFLRRGDASEPEIAHAITDMTRLIADYEFLLSLSR